MRKRTPGWKRRMPPGPIGLILLMGPLILGLAVGALGSLLFLLVNWARSFGP